MMIRSRPGWRLLTRRLWRWSPLLTLPFVVFLALWLTATYERFHDFGVRYDGGPVRAQLRIVGNAEISHMVSKVGAALRPAPALTRLRTIDLFLNESDEVKLDQRLPHSGRKYVRGHLLYPSGKSYRVKIRYRGDFGWHWGYYKKSLRIKTRKTRLFDGMRKLNLIAPKFDETLNNHLAYVLAKHMGVLAPHSEMVNLRVNGSYRGVYTLVEQLEELTLRRQQRMPGDLYSGEIIGRDTYHGVRNRLVDTVAFWEKLAVNNHYPEASARPLEEFLALVRRGSGAMARDASWKQVDIDAWGRFFAFETLVQTFHFSDRHNWRLYYDPWRNSVSPIVWDPDGWHPLWRRDLGGEPRMDVVSSDIHQTLLAHHGILLARHRTLEQFFETGGAQSFLAEVDRVAAATRAALAADPNVVYGNFRHIPPDSARAAVERLRETIHQTTRYVRDAYLGGDGQVSWQAGGDGTDVRFVVEGRRPVDAVELRTDPPPKVPKRVELVSRVAARQVTVDVTGAVSVRGDTLRVEVPLLARHVVRGVIRGDAKFPDPVLSRPIDLLAGYATLRFQPSLSERLTEVRVERGGRLETAAAADIGTAQSYPAGTVLAVGRPMRRPVRWSGEVRIEGVRVIEEDVLVDPGTTVYLAAGASVILQGRIIADGTEQQPIRFVPAREATEPWGTLALRGGGANGSRLRHCQFEGGSGYKHDLAEYSAMFSIHDVREVTIEDCSFRDSRIVDDMVHAVYSEVTFRRCSFEGAPFDALDLDISEAVVQSCFFSRSGNDALDLMETEAVVLDTLLTGSGDKGISVGEGSRLWAINDTIEGNAIGVESKDRSVAVLANITLRDNDQALHAYQKNWRYGVGGAIRLLKSQVHDNDKPIRIEARSRLSVFDSYVDQTIVGSKYIEVDATVDQEARTQARVVEPVQRPEEEWSSAKLFAPYWARVDATRRGAEENAP